MDDWNAVSVFSMQGLLNLEKLEIKNCGRLLEVFKLEGLLTREGEQNMVLLKLKKMLLHDLPELRCIWKGPTQLINFNNLEYLEVIGCKKLIYLFTLTLAQSLHNLKFLIIERCGELEHLIAKDEEDHILSSKSHLQPQCFPNLEHIKVIGCNKLKYLFYMGWNAISMQGLLNLEKLEIKNCEKLQEVFQLEGLLTREREQQDVFLSRLKILLLHHLIELRCIWKGPIHLIKLNNLEDLQVFDCKKLIHLFTPTLARSLQILKFLEIERCDELEYVIAKDEENRILSERPLQTLCFPKLYAVTVEECNKLKCLFPITVVDSLLKLSSLKVKGASQLAEVFTHDDEGNTVVQKDVMLPQLECITLECLPSLVNFYPRNYHAILPKLDSLEVQSCLNMTRSFAPTPDKTMQVNGEVPIMSTVFIYYFFSIMVSYYCYVLLLVNAH